MDLIEKDKEQAEKLIKLGIPIIDIKYENDKEIYIFNVNDIINRIFED